MYKTNYYNIPYTDPRDTKERFEFKFKSWSEFLENLDYRVKNNIKYSSQCSSHNPKEGSFNSHFSFNDAVKEVMMDKSLEKTESNELFENVKNNIKLKIADEPLGGIDVPTFLSGEPECFETYIPKVVKQKKKVVENIFVMVGVTHWISESDLSRYIKETMENIYKNYLFKKVVIFTVSEDYSEHFQFYIDIPYRDVPYILRTCYADFFRRLIFFFKEQWSGLGWGYGTSLHEKRDKLKEFVGDNELFVYN